MSLRLLALALAALTLAACGRHTQTMAAPPATDAGVAADTSSAPVSPPPDAGGIGPQPGMAASAGINGLTTTPGQTSNGDNSNNSGGAGGTAASGGSVGGGMSGGGGTGGAAGGGGGP